jgi:hypothetical protein
MSDQEKKQGVAVTAFLQIEGRLIEATRRLSNLLKEHDEPQWSDHFRSAMNALHEADTIRGKRDAVGQIRFAFQGAGSYDDFSFATTDETEKLRQRISALVYELAGQYVTQLPAAAAQGGVRGWHRESSSGEGQ